MTTKKRFKFIVAVHAFFIKDSKVLLLKRTNTGYMDSFYSVPAGHVDGGESIPTAMAREVYEEIGIEFDAPLDPSLVMHRLVSDNEERIDYFFKITDWRGDPKNNEEHKCAGLKWFDCKSLPEKTIPYVGYALSEVLSNKKFTEFNEMD